MVSIKGKRKRGKISRDEITSYAPTHIKFNFSFICDNKEFCIEQLDKKYIADTFIRIVKMSQCSYVELMNMRKNIGLESIPDHQIPKANVLKKKLEVADKDKHCSDKFFVFRIYPNNNPLPARVLGKMNNKVFYILGFTLDHSAY